MGFHSNIASTAAVMIATRNVRGGGGGLSPDDEPENVLNAFMLILWGMVCLMVLFIVWVLFCDCYGTPTVTRSNCGTITVIDARPYKSTFHYEISTTGGCSLTFYDTEPVRGETLFVTLTRRPLKREVNYTTQSGCHSGYNQFWPFIRD